MLNTNGRQFTFINSVDKTKFLYTTSPPTQHSNINADSHLNRSGLHLNSRGTSQLARNFMDFIILLVNGISMLPPGSLTVLHGVSLLKISNISKINPLDKVW